MPTHSIRQNGKSGPLHTYLMGHRLTYYQDPSFQDPSAALDEAQFEEAKETTPGTHHAGTLYWKCASAWVKQDGGPYRQMQTTGQLTVRIGWIVYLAGGEFRKR